ncbi:NUDIX domain-containing protein [Paenibacillus sp. LMG 31456]|uniref:NUDIX domain-containing protein n=1 Tax=Paenibacillus foliorum TaxID=2654974 RepID=A0A972GSZ6_9BACL|nr:NUDIX domain-containing protein [Paenibacillus foliorum]NOU93633.1 NUDIX domain-containing protein [Paenibacillus foliorum]
MGEARFYYKNMDAPTPNQPMSVGVVALIEKDNKLLMERRTDSRRWAIIGGAIKKDESLIDGLYREVNEETGLKISKYELFGTFSDPSRIIQFPDGNVKRIITIAYKVEVEPYEKLVCSDESLELKYINRAELELITVAETHISILEHYMKNHNLILE